MEFESFQLILAFMRSVVWMFMFDAAMIRAAYGINILAPSWMETQIRNMILQKCITWAALISILFYPM